MSAPVPVRPSQIWADNDKRGYGRRVRVIEVDPTHAVVEQVTGRRPGQGKSGRRTRIRLNRFRPTSTGYRLVQDADPSVREATDRTVAPLNDLTAELAQVMRDANTPEAWAFFGPQIVPFHHFAEVAIRWMRSTVLPAHRRQVLDEAGEAAERLTEPAEISPGIYVDCEERHKAAYLRAAEAIRRLADEGSP